MMQSVVVNFICDQKILNLDVMLTVFKLGQLSTA